MAEKELILTHVKVAGGDIKLELTSPYNPDLVKHCRQLGGRWNKIAKKWYFDPSQDNQLSEVCYEVFGVRPTLAFGDNQSLVVNTAYQAALDYVQGIKAQAAELSEEEKNEVLMSLLEALS